MFIRIFLLYLTLFLLALRVYSGDPHSNFVWYRSTAVSLLVSIFLFLWYYGGKIYCYVWKATRGRSYFQKAVEFIVVPLGPVFSVLVFERAVLYILSDLTGVILLIFWYFVSVDKSHSIERFMWDRRVSDHRLYSDDGVLSNKELGKIDMIYFSMFLAPFVVKLYWSVI